MRPLSDVFPVPELWAWWLGWCFQQSELLGEEVVRHGRGGVDGLGTEEEVMALAGEGIAETMDYFIILN